MGSFEDHQWKPGQSGNPKGSHKRGKGGLRDGIIRVLQSNQSIDTLDHRSPPPDFKPNVWHLALFAVRKAGEDLKQLQWLTDQADGLLPRDQKIQTEDLSMSITLEDKREAPTPAEARAQAEAMLRESRE